MFLIAKIRSSCRWNLILVQPNIGSAVERIYIYCQKKVLSSRERDIGRYGACFGLEVFVSQE